MNREYKFKIGQEVAIMDEFGWYVYGVVTDTSANSVFISWEDTGQVEHSPAEYGKISLVKVRRDFGKDPGEAERIKKRRDEQY
jgi:hypothetical protein